jgi:DsbC/DsbD-like thiol-disulfide interchange protein
MRAFALLLVAGASFFATAEGALAQAPAPIFPHQHFLVLPDGSPLPVGPDICANAAAAQGFFGFHQNVHFGTPSQVAFQEPNNPVGFRAIGQCPPA